LLFPSLAKDWVFWRRIFPFLGKKSARSIKNRKKYENRLEKYKLTIDKREQKWYYINKYRYFCTFRQVCGALCASRA